MGCRSSCQTGQHLGRILTTSLLLATLTLPNVNDVFCSATTAIELTGTEVFGRHVDREISKSTTGNSRRQKASSSSSVVGRDPVRSRLSRVYRLYNRCSMKYVRIAGKIVDAWADGDDVYSQIEVDTINFDSHLRMRSRQTREFICFNKQGRLAVKPSGSDRRCVFRELHSVDHYTQFQSVVNDSWFLGFDAKGRRLNAASASPSSSSSSSTSSISTSPTRRTRSVTSRSAGRSRSSTSSATDPSISSSSSSSAAAAVTVPTAAAATSSSPTSAAARRRPHRVRHSSTSNQRCFHFVKADLTEDQPGGDGTGPVPVDYQRLFARLGGSSSVSTTTTTTTTSTTTMSTAAATTTTTKKKKKMKRTTTTLRPNPT